MRLAWLWWGVMLVAGTTSAENGYVGGERCRLCHRSTYGAWLTTAHARTDRAGVEGPTCVRCHLTDSATKLRGVQCEACHGAGESYALPEVMIDPEKARMAGLVKPTEAVCRRCHGSATDGHEATFEMPPPSTLGAVVHDRTVP